MGAVRFAFFSILFLSCAHAPAEPVIDESAIAERAMESVVLLVSTGPNQGLSFGSGLIIDDDGLVLTNQHVAQAMPNLAAMRYVRGLTSYTPMDGGLERFLFENQKRFVGARVVFADATTDLALVRIASDTRDAPRLPFATRLPARNDRVIAVGHPAETLWSFTAGVISALHDGAIQHDAILSPGSSGGPLLNSRGEVVGINTFRLMGDGLGLGIARPIEMARWLMHTEDESPSLDLSSPTAAAMSCLRAQELASPYVGDCLDWNRRWALFQSARDAVSAMVGPEVLATVPGIINRAVWEQRSRDALALFLREGSMGELDLGLPPAPEKTREITASWRQAQGAQASRQRTRNGLVTSIEQPLELRQTFRRGMRVESVVEVKPGVAWVALTGRNVDRSEYRFSECWVRPAEQTVWRQQWPATAENDALMPSSFPPPLETEHEARLAIINGLLRRLYTVAP